LHHIYALKNWWSWTGYTNYQWDDGTMGRLMTPDYSFYETRNSSILRRVLSHQDIQDFMFIDVPDGPMVFKLIKLMDPKYTIYAMRVNLELAGIALFDKNDEEAVVDVAFLPKFRGKDAKILAKNVILDYIEKYGVRALTGKIRRNNLRSLLFARWNNFNIVSSDDTYHYVRCECHGRNIEFT
jgi:hypothetical protein